MKSNFSQVGKVLRILIWPVLVGIGQFLIVAILSAVFMQSQIQQMHQQYPNETDQQILERVNNLDLAEPLNAYMEDHLLYVVLWNVLFILPLLIYFYRKYKVKKIDIQTYSPLLLLSPIAFCLCFHLILIALGVRYQITTSNYYWIFVLSEGLIGPIIEEYLFRGIVYHKLQEIYSKKNSMIFCTIIFTFFHNNLLQIIFAGLLGTILICLYEKYQDIKVPIFFHVMVNLTSVLVVPQLQNLHFILLIILFVVSAICIYHFLYKIFPKRNN